MAMTVEEAKQAKEDGAFAFYAAMGSQDALDILTNGTLAEYSVKGDSKDATSLAHMLEALDYIDYCNNLRAEYHDLPALKVSDVAMAAAAHNANWADNGMNHPSSAGYGWPVVYSAAGENLAWGYSTPEGAFNAWYWKEKTNYEEQNGGQTGHYLSIISSTYTATGFAVSTDTGWGTCQEQYFLGSFPGAVYTVAEYRQRLQDYIDGLDAVIAGISDDSPTGDNGTTPGGNGTTPGGNDTLSGGNDSPSGGNGSDAAVPDIKTDPGPVADFFGRAMASGKTGKNRKGTAGPDRLTGTKNNDTLKGLSGNDTLVGGKGHDRLIGGKGNDSLLGGAGNDCLLGGAGRDTLRGGRGDDWLDGGRGLDSLVGGAGNDTLLGGAGRDTLKGGAGDDWLDGGKGGDVLIGGTGDDTLVGGPGRDTLTGGAGNDVFLFNVAPGGRNADLITDFAPGEDSIALARSVFGKLTAGPLSAAGFAANETGTAQRDTDYIIYNTKTGALLYDADGTGSGAAVEIATLRNKPKLRAADIFVVA